MDWEWHREDCSEGMSDYDEWIWYISASPAWANETNGSEARWIWNYWQWYHTGVKEDHWDWYDSTLYGVHWAQGSDLYVDPEMNPQCLWYDEDRYTNHTMNCSDFGMR